MTRSEAVERLGSELLKTYPILLVLLFGQKASQHTGSKSIAAPVLLLPSSGTNLSFKIAAGSLEWPIFEHAVRVFGQTSEAIAWVTGKSPVLNARPIELLETAEGRQKVDNVLNCIEHGMIY